MASFEGLLGISRGRGWPNTSAPGSGLWANRVYQRSEGLFIVSAAALSGPRGRGRVAPHNKGGSHWLCPPAANQTPGPFPWQKRPSPLPPPRCALSACSESGWSGRTGAGQQPSSAGAKGAPQVLWPDWLGLAAPAETQRSTTPCSPATCSRSKPCSKMKTPPT